jgi:hypothetical protein
MLIYDNYRGARVLPETTDVAPEPESDTKTWMTAWILATVAAVGVFGAISWWLT